MAAFVLEVVDRSGKTFMVPMGVLPFSVGRSPENHLTLTHPSISREHAVFEALGDDVVLVDRGSRNGVHVNGKTVSRKALRPGDSVRLGSVEMLLCRAPTIRVRGSNDKLETFYYSQKDDLTGTCFLEDESVPAAEGAGTEAGRAKAPDWHKLIGVSLKSGVTDVYQKAIDAVEASTDFDRCYLLLFEGGDPDSLQVLERRFSAECTSARGIATADDVAISHEILRRVVAEREAVLVTEEDPTVSARDTFIRSGTRSALCFPLVLRNQVGGVLYLDRLSSREPFTEDDVAKIGPLVGILALKIENVQLLEEAERKEPEADRP